MTICLQTLKYFSILKERRKKKGERQNEKHWKSLLDVNQRISIRFSARLVFIKHFNKLYFSTCF